MLDKIIAFSIHHKLIVGLGTLALIVWGVFSFTQLPIDAVPDITNNQAQIITVSPAMAAQEMERLVTFPVEQAVATVPEIEEVRSFSRFGLSVVTVVFKEDVDLYWARQQISERLQSVKDIIPMEKDEKLNGIITADVMLKGRMSSIEKEQYKDFNPSVSSGISVSLLLSHSNDVKYGGI